jgi:hypothetical protein
MISITTWAVKVSIRKHEFGPTVKESLWSVNYEL